MQKFQFTIIQENQVNLRIDKYLSDSLTKENISRSRIQNLISEKHLKKDNTIITNISHKTKLNDCYTLTITPLKESQIIAKDIPLDIVYEDQDMLVINKQAGLTTHPGAGNKENTLVNALLNYCGKNLSEINGTIRPGIVHRLDKDTSGLMVVAKNDKAHQSLTEQIQERILKRHYLAIVWGSLRPQKGQITGNIQRNRYNRLKMELTTNNKGKHSVTNYNTQKTYGKNTASLIECVLDTGRTHQIRVHCHSKKCPLIGDQTYGGKSHILSNKINLIQKEIDFINNFSRQALHSYKISFHQPSSQKLLEFETKFPKDLSDLTKILKKIQ